MLVSKKVVNFGSNDRQRNTAQLVSKTALKPIFLNLDEMSDMREAMDLELPNGLGDWGEVVARGRPFVVARGL